MRSKPCADSDVLLPAEFLFLESFLQTFKREWTGLDRLRMDKFFQVSVPTGQAWNTLTENVELFDLNWD